MTTWLCNYSSTISCKAQHSLLPSATISTASSSVHFSADAFQSIVFSTYSLISVIYNVTYFSSQLPCYKLYLHCTQPVTFHISFPVYVYVQIDAVQTPIKRSLPALNLPAVLPRALEMEKGRLGVTMLRVLIQRNPTAVLFLITHEPCVCANPLHSTPQP